MARAQKTQRRASLALAALAVALCVMPITVEGALRSPSSRPLKRPHCAARGCMCVQSQRGLPCDAGAPSRRPARHSSSRMIRRPRFIEPCNRVADRLGGGAKRCRFNPHYRGRAGCELCRRETPWGVCASLKPCSCAGQPPRWRAALALFLAEAVQRTRGACNHRPFVPSTGASVWTTLETSGIRRVAEAPNLQCATLLGCTRHGGGMAVWRRSSRSMCPTTRRWMAITRP